jgi:CheY-like chemotaxis protein
VLAIDDEADILASLAALLPHFGCEVRCALDLAAATAVLDAGFVPQLLLVDHRLKGASGTQVIAALRERIGPVPAVIVTGDTSPQDLISALGGGTRVVHKPLDGRLLARAMAEAVG